MVLHVLQLSSRQGQNSQSHIGGTAVGLSVLAHTHILFFNLNKINQSPMFVIV